jgi:hypothetical protein
VVKKPAGIRVRSAIQAPSGGGQAIPLEMIMSSMTSLLERHEERAATDIRAAAGNPQRGCGGRGLGIWP